MDFDIENTLTVDIELLKLLVYQKMYLVLLLSHLMSSKFRLSSSSDLYTIKERECLDSEYENKDKDRNTGVISLSLVFSLNFGKPLFFPDLRAVQAWLDSQQPKR